MTTSADIIEAVGFNSLVITDVNEQLTTADLIVGAESGAKGQIDTITRNGVEKNFNSFIQLYKYQVTVLSGNFDENEVVYQGFSVTNATATALLHSIETAGSVHFLYTSNQVGQFTSNAYILGANSLAVADITTSWSPELKFGSGDVLYIENMEAVNRANDQTESYQLIFTF
jgi:hypothetical protein